MLNIVRLALTLGAICITSTALAQSFDGNELHRRCQQSNSDALMFTMGVADGIAIGGATGSRYSICPPPEVQNQQLRDVACQTVANEPISRHEPAGLLVFNALSEAYPCT